MLGTHLGERYATGTAKTRDDRRCPPKGRTLIAAAQIAPLLVSAAQELALFAGVGFLLFALDDLLVDLIYLGRRIWRGATVYTRFPRASAG